jgi:hypothetical protein
MNKSGVAASFTDRLVANKTAAFDNPTNLKQIGSLLNNRYGGPSSK